MTATNQRTDERAPQVGAPGAVLPPLRIGPLQIDTPVVLAPMAGVTNAAFRRLCRESGAGLYVAEMVTSRALVERGEESLRIISHEPDEKPRSVQVYGVDPATVGAAVRLIVERGPRGPRRPELRLPGAQGDAPRRGRGAAVEAGPVPGDRHAAVVDAAAPYGVPVTVKMRKGIDEDHLTYLEAGLVAQDAGVAAVALHARTAADYYSGTADWESIARLKQTVTDIPVLGNGDIWSAEDALAMVEQTGLRRRRRRAGVPGPAVAVRGPRGCVRRFRRARAPRAASRRRRSSAGTPS